MSGKPLQHNKVESAGMLVYSMLISSMNVSNLWTLDVIGIDSLTGN